MAVLCTWGPALPAIPQHAAALSCQQPLCLSGQRVARSCVGVHIRFPLHY